MKRCANRQSLVLFVGLACLIGLAAIAHADWRVEARMNVPFAFVVDNTTLPAGEYVFYTHHAELNLLQVESADGDVGLVTFTENLPEGIEPASSDAVLVFEEMDDTRFLAELHLPASDQYWEISKGRMYEELKASGADRMRSEVSAADEMAEKMTADS